MTPSERMQRLDAIRQRFEGGRMSGADKRWLLDTLEQTERELARQRRSTATAHQRLNAHAVGFESNVRMYGDGSAESIARGFRLAAGIVADHCDVEDVDLMPALRASVAAAAAGGE